MTKHASASQSPLPQFEQQELFMEVGGRLMPTEEAAVDSHAVQNEVMAGIRLKLKEREPSFQDRMDAARRASGALAGQEYLERIAVDDVHQPSPNKDTLLPMVLQGTFNNLDIERSKRPQGAKVAFGRYLKSRVFDRAGQYMSFRLLTDGEKSLMRPDGLAPLFYRDRKDRQSTKGLFYIDDVLVNQYEYRLIPRSPEALARDSAAKTYGELDIDEDPELHARAERSVVHTFKAKIPKLEEHREGLVAKRDDVQRLLKHARNPGAAWISPEDMEQLIGSVWSEFDTIVHTLSVREKWDKEHLDAAKSALLQNLTKGMQAGRVGNFVGMLTFANRYLNTRIRIINNRLVAAGVYVPAETEDPEEQSAEQPIANAGA